MTEPCVARFKTHKQFYVVGIGLILTGEVLEGKISYGNHIEFTADGTEVQYTITDVETIEYMNAGTSETALILELEAGDKEVNYLEAIAGDVIEIT